MHSASHNRVKEICATHKFVGLTANPVELRNGCLIFWKLGPPNLIPGFVSFPTDSQKAVCKQHPSWNSNLIGQPGRNFSPDRHCERGNIADRWAQFRLTSR
jgi:hypothetical protein